MGKIQRRTTRRKWGTGWINIRSDGTTSSHTQRVGKTTYNFKSDGKIKTTQSLGRGVVDVSESGGKRRARKRNITNQLSGSEVLSLLGFLLILVLIFA